MRADRVFVVALFGLTFGIWLLNQEPTLSGSSVGESRSEMIPAPVASPAPRALQEPGGYPSALPSSAPTVTAALHDDQSSSSAGYKGARWGGSAKDVEQALHASLSPIRVDEEDGGPRAPVNLWALNYLLYEKWGVPKHRSIFSPDEYSHSVELLPPAFSIYEGRDGDEFVFYENRFYAYVAELQAENYASHLSHLRDRYGSPVVQSVSFRAPDDADEQHDAVRHTWEVGATTIELIRDSYDTALDVRVTDVYVIYCSAKADRQIRDAVAKALVEAQIEDAKRDAEQNRKDLDKLP